MCRGAVAALGVIAPAWLPVPLRVGVGNPGERVAGNWAVSATSGPSGGGGLNSSWVTNRTATRSAPVAAWGRLGELVETLLLQVILLDGVGRVDLEQARVHLAGLEVLEPLAADRGVPTAQVIHDVAPQQVIHPRRRHRKAPTTIFRSVRGSYTLLADFRVSFSGIVPATVLGPLGEPNGPTVKTTARGRRCQQRGFRIPASRSNLSEKIFSAESDPRG